MCMRWFNMWEECGGGLDVPARKPQDIQDEQTLGCPSGNEIWIAFLCGIPQQFIGDELWISMLLWMHSTLDSS